LIWLGQALVASVLGLACAGVIVGRHTRWGRQIRRLTIDFFKPSNGLLPLTWLALMIFMSLFGVRVNVLFSYWNNGLFTAMQNLDAEAFWFMVVVFCLLACILLLHVVVNTYLQQAFQIRWRVWLTNSLIDRWLTNQSYYRSLFVNESADSPDQRIQQDVERFVNTSVNLFVNLLGAMVSLFAFSVILWNLSGSLVLLGVEIPRAMIFIVYLYAIVATLFAWRIGRPLIRLNYLNEQFNADFRYAMIRMRDYGESIAFYQGEAVERKNLLARFANVTRNMWAIVFRSLRFQGFNVAITQAAIVFPFMVQAPRLLSRQITLGDVMQSTQAFGHVETSLSFFRNSYDMFAGYRAVIDRLTDLMDLMDAAEQLPSIQIEAGTEILVVEHLSVRSPDHALLVDDLNFTLRKAESLLIRGASGIGKTTMLRALAGLWPYVEGKLVRPIEEHSLFLPQKPYLPLGTLRSALSYPSLAPPNGNTASVMKQCQLGHLYERLDEDDDWSRILSLGEQQRLGIARVLLNRPQVVFLDEASSAMDESLEYSMYQLLRESLPDAILVSVGHRSSLLEFHHQELQLLGDGQWRLQALAPSDNPLFEQNN
jgi:putative ATP-binding cassette transporter